MAQPSPATAATMLRVLVRAGLIAVLLAIGWVAFTKLRDAQPQDAATLSARPRTVEVDPAAPRLDQIVLTLADLPRGWSAQASAPESEDICEGRTPQSVIIPTGIDSAAFTMDDNQALVGNVVHEFGDDDTAEAFMDLTARVLDSCREYTAGESTVRLTPLSFPALGDQSFVVEAAGGGPTGALHGAIIYLRNDNRVASLALITFGDTAVNSELIEHLTRLVDRRMTTPPAIDSEVPGADTDGDTGPLPGE